MSGRLSYEGKWIPELIQAINDDNDCLDIANQTIFPDMSTKIPLYVEWSQQEFTEILSAVVNGSIQTSPDIYQNVVATFLRIVFCDMDICDAIAECISTNSAVQNVIFDLVQTFIQQNNGVYNPNQPLSPSILQGNLTPTDALCTEPNKYAMALAIVRQLDQSSQDALEIVEVATNTAELAVELSDNAGILGALPASALEVAAWLQDTIAENYNAAYTSATEEALACAVYCAFNDCDLTFEDIYDAYQSALSITIPDVSDLETVLNFLTGLGALADLQIVGQMHLWALSILRWGSEWMNLGTFNAIKIAMQGSSDETISVPGNCACASPPCWEFGISPQNEAVEGIYLGNDQFQATDGGFNSTSRYRIVVKINNPDGSNSFDILSVVSGSPDWVRVYADNPPTGNPTFQGTIAQAIAASPLSGEYLDIYADTPDYIIEMLITANACEP